MGSCHVSLLVIFYNIPIIHLTLGFAKRIPLGLKSTRCFRIGLIDLYSAPQDPLLSASQKRKQNASSCGDFCTMIHHYRMSIKRLSSISDLPIQFPPNPLNWVYQTVTRFTRGRYRIQRRLIKYLPSGVDKLWHIGLASTVADPAMGGQGAPH